METSKAHWDRIIAENNYNDNGVIHYDGWAYHCIDDCTEQVTHHLRLGRI